MKQIIFTLLLLAAIGFSSCRKTTVEPGFKEYDQAQIQNYISAQGLSSMTRDTSGGDTTGIYYSIISPGTGAVINYSDQISMVFSIRTLDGKYISADTIRNHYYDYAGHIASNKLPFGLQTGVHNILKNRGGSMRLLIPSHLAYGVNGYGTGSTQNTNTKIGGNQSLDVYVHVIDNQASYDDQVINSYIKANNLTGYTKTPSGLYYSIITPGTGTSQVNVNSSITANYTDQLFNGFVFDGSGGSANPAALPVMGLIQGVQEGLISRAMAGSKISFLIPSALGYNTVAQSVIPPNSCLQFTFTVITVTP